MTPLDVLTNIRELLSDSLQTALWSISRNQIGDGVNVTSKDAVCWCLLGALYHVCPTDEEVRNGAYEVIASVIKKTSYIPNDRPVASFNDHASYSRVIEVLDEAISKALTP